MSDISGAEGPSFYVTSQFEGKRLRVLERVITADGVTSAWQESPWFGPVEAPNTVGFYHIGWAPTVDATEFEPLDGATVDTTFLFPQLVIEQPGPAIARVDWLAIGPSGEVLWERTNDVDPPYNLRWNGQSFPEGTNTVTATVVYVDPANAPEVIVATFVVDPPETEIPDPPDLASFAGYGTTGAYARVGHELDTHNGDLIVASGQTYEDLLILGKLIFPGGVSNVTVDNVHAIYGGIAEGNTTGCVVRWSTLGPTAPVAGTYYPSTNYIPGDTQNRTLYDQRRKEAWRGPGNIKFERDEFCGMVDGIQVNNTSGVMDDCWLHDFVRQAQDPYQPTSSHNDPWQAFGTGRLISNRCRVDAFSFGSATGRSFGWWMLPGASRYSGTRGTGWFMGSPGSARDWEWNDSIFDGHIIAGIYLLGSTGGFKLRRNIFIRRAVSPSRALIEGSQSIVTVFDGNRAGLSETDTVALSKSRAFTKIENW